MDIDYKFLVGTIVVEKKLNKCYDNQTWQQVFEQLLMGREKLPMVKNSFRIWLNPEMMSRVDF